MNSILINLAILTTAVVLVSGLPPVPNCRGSLPSEAFSFTFKQDIQAIWIYVNGVCSQEIAQGYHDIYSEHAAKPGAYDMVEVNGGSEFKMTQDIKTDQKEWMDLIIAKVMQQL